MQIRENVKMFEGTFMELRHSAADIQTNTHRAFGCPLWWLAPQGTGPLSSDVGEASRTDTVGGVLGAFSQWTFRWAIFYKKKLHSTFALKVQGHST